MDEYKMIFSALSEEDISEQMYALIERLLQNKYGTVTGTLVQKRVHDEWDAMEQHQMTSAVAALYDLVSWLKSRQYPYCMNYGAGSSFILYLLGITSGNPLPHEFGGVNIPWQSLWGYGNYCTELHVELPSAHEQEIREIVPSILNKRFLAKNQCCAQINGHGVREINMSKVILWFTLEESVVTPEFYEQRCISCDRIMIMENWERYISCKLMKRYGLPEPIDVEDIITLRGMGQASGAVDKDTADLVAKYSLNISDIIAFRDDVYSYLLTYGFSKEEAWKGARRVGSGRGLPVITKGMESAPDKWKISQCAKARYLPLKAGIVERMMYEHKLYTLFGYDKQCCF